MITLVVLLALMFALTTEAASLEKREPELDSDVIELETRNNEEKRKGRKEWSRKAKIPGLMEKRN